MNASHLRKRKWLDDYSLRNNRLLLLNFSDMMCGRLFFALPYADFPLLSEFGLHSFDGFRNTGSSCDDYGMGAIDLGLVPNGAKCDEGKVRHCRLALAVYICGKMDAPITL